MYTLIDVQYMYMYAHTEHIDMNIASLLVMRYISDCLGPGFDISHLVQQGAISALSCFKSRRRLFVMQEFIIAGRQAHKHTREVWPGLRHRRPAHFKCYKGVRTHVQRKNACREYGMEGEAWH